MLLDRGAERLDEEHVALAAVGLELRFEAVVGEAAQPHRAEWLAQVCADLGGQLRMGAAAEHRDVPHADQGSWPAPRPSARPAMVGAWAAGRSSAGPAPPARAAGPRTQVPAAGAPPATCPATSAVGTPAAAAAANTVPATFP